MTILRSRSNKKAYSLLEIIIVIALLAILLAIGIPSFINARDNAVAREEARELCSDLELTKSYAKNGDGTAELAWEDPKDSSPGYKVIDDTGAVRKTKTFSHKVVVDFSGWTGDSIKFNSNGSTADDGQVSLKIKGANNRRKYYTMSVNKVTGMIKFTEVN